MKITPVILAAGQGTRMRSALPKVLHPVLGQPMLSYVLEATQAVCEEKPVVVIGHEAGLVRQAFEETAEFIVQEPQLGTGHAVMQAEKLLKGKTDLVLVVAADMALLRAETLGKLVKMQETHDGPITMLTVVGEDPRGFGRVVRETGGRVLQVVEEAQATVEQLNIRELNTSVYCFEADWLWRALKQIMLSPKGEYYLTDLVAIAAAEDRSVMAYVLDDPHEAIGINTRVHLAEAEAWLRSQVNHQWMLSGVTIIDPATTYIERGVRIGQDSVIWPNTYLRGTTLVGEGCTLGPNTILTDTSVGDRCQVLASVVEGAVVEDHVHIGPYSHLRKGAHLAQGVYIGNFGEIKNSYLGSETHVGHFSYIGDATLGSHVNVGAGTITCNFDGEKKNATEIGSEAFIGSDTMLIAPVKLGEGARTGAGSVVTRDVAAHTLVAGVPARAIRKLEKRD